MFWTKRNRKVPQSAEVQNKMHTTAHVKSALQVGHAAEIPNNYLASSRLSDYRNFRLLTELEKRDVVTYCHLYRPSIVRNLIFFEVTNNNQLLPNSSNNFLAFDDPIVIASFKLPSNSIVVDGVHSIIHRVMVYKYGWLHDYFQVPFDQEKWRIGLSPRPVYFVRTTPGYDPSHCIDVPFWCAAGLIFVFFVFPPVGIALIAIGGCRACCEVANAVAAPKKTQTTYVVY